MNNNGEQYFQKLIKLLIPRFELSTSISNRSKSFPKCHYCIKKMGYFIVAFFLLSNKCHNVANGTLIIQNLFPHEHLKKIH